MADPFPSPFERWSGLIWTLVRTDFKSRYHGTIAGFLWALAKPFFVFLVLMTVFSWVFRDRANYRLELVVGIFLWDFWAEGTKFTLLSLVAKGYLLSKARFPSWILVVTALSNPLLTLGVFSAVITGFLAAAGRFPGPLQLALYLVYVLHFAAIVTGFGLVASVLFLRYRDLNQVWEVVTHAGFFVAPVVLPLDAIPSQYHLALYVWPPTPVIEFARAVLVQGAIPTLRAHLCLTLLALCVLSVGVLVFRRLGQRPAEHL